MNTDRIISSTTIHLTREDGKRLSFGEGEVFEIFRLRGLGIGEIEKETVGNAMTDGELWLGSRVVSRVLEIESEWQSATQRSVFADFFQHNMRMSLELDFDGRRYHGSCVLHEAYDIEQHGGGLYSGSGIELALYFDDPHLYTDTVYRYQIGNETTLGTFFYTLPAQHGLVFPPGEGLIHSFSVFREPQEYRIDNPSSTPNGIEARIRAFDVVRNPSITNLTTGMGLQFDLTLQPGDEMYLNTQVGFITATRNGEDVLRHLTLPSRMIQVRGGENRLLFSADENPDKAGCEISFRGKVLAI